MKTYFAIQAIGKDRPGLAATITRVVHEELGFNIETSSMTIIGGHFATSLIASSSDRLEEDHVSRVFDELEPDPLTGAVVVSRLGVEDFRPAWREASYEVIAGGPEQPGLIYHATKALAEHGINITGLNSTCVDGKHCTIVFDVTVTGDLGASQLEQLVGDALPEGMTVTATPMQRSRENAP